MGRSVRRLPAGLHGGWRRLHEYVSVERSTGNAGDAHHRCNAASYLDVEWKCLGVGYSDAVLAVISMLLFLYLRRWFVGLRAGVGGPVVLPASMKDSQSAREPFELVYEHASIGVGFSIFGLTQERLHILSDLNRGVRVVLQIIEVRLKQESLQIHCTSLRPGDRERHRPFIPVLAGGNG